MPKASLDSTTKRGGRIRLWAGLSTADAFGRLLVQAATTAILARLMAPEAFGTAALVLSLAGFLGVLMRTLFEEALAQRKTVRREHFETALFATLLIAIVLSALVIPVGALLADFFAVPNLGMLVATSMLIPISLAPCGVGTGWARRRRRFDLIALSNFVGFFAGAVTAISLGLLGAEVWALLSFQIIAACMTTIVLFVSLGFAIRPRWSRKHFDQLRWYTKYSLISCFTDNAGYLVTNYIVASIYGLTALGYLNMAFRVITPIRTAIISISHNLVFSLFVSVRSDRDRLAASVLEVAGHVSFLALPIFLGLVAVAPALIPLFAGPGWDPAAEIAEWLALGSAVVAPILVIATALNASGRPQYNAVSTLSGVAVMVGILPLAHPLGAVASGIAWFCGDVARALYTLVTGTKHLGLRRARFLAPISVAWMLAVIMAVAVVMVGRAVDGVASLPVRLILEIATGVLVYAAGIAIVVPDRARMVWDVLRARKTRFP